MLVPLPDFQKPSLRASAYREIPMRRCASPARFRRRGITTNRDSPCVRLPLLVSFSRFQRTEKPAPRQPSVFSGANGALRYRRRVKALVKSKREPGLWLDDVEEPQIGINDVLIKVLKTGICGTDV